MADQDAFTQFAISIHAPREGATGATCRRQLGCKISIHAPREGATATVKQAFFLSDISIHAPREGATLVSGLGVTTISFQSTLPVRERPDSAGKF